MNPVAALCLQLGLLVSDARRASQRRRTIRQAHDSHAAYRRAVRAAMAAEGRGEPTEWPRYPGSWL